MPLPELGAAAPPLADPGVLPGVELGLLGVLGFVVAVSVLRLQALSDSAVTTASVLASSKGRSRDRSVVLMTNPWLN